MPYDQYKKKRNPNANTTTTHQVSNTSSTQSSTTPKLHNTPLKKVTTTNDS